MNGKNCVFLVRNVAPEMYGGAEIYQLKIAEQLKKYNFCPVILTNSAKLIEESKRLNVEILIPPCLQNQNWSGWRNLLLPKYWMFQRKLRRWYREEFDKYRPVVINVQSRDDMIAATMAATGGDIRILWTDHADFLNWTLWNVNVRFKNIIGKKMIKLSTKVDKVIFVGRNLKCQTERMIAPKKIHNAVVIENGVEDRVGFYEDRHVKRHSFVYLGRVTPDKGMSELVKAFQIVVREYPEATLNIYGEGDIDRYKKMAGEGVKFWGRTEEPLRVMAENEMFVLPSYREGLSLSLLDAAMMGKKIIASDVDGNPEVVQDRKTGLLVPAKNAEKLAEAMIWMIKNKKQADMMAQKVREHYEENFDLDKIFAEKMLPLYNVEKED